MIEIVRISINGLEREVWRFVLFAPRYSSPAVVNATIDYYGRETRATLRHKFKADPAQRFSAFDRRSYYSGLKDVDVPLPEDVADEIKRRVTIVVHRPEVDRRSLAQ